ncbi:DEAD/DEAH box helicase family protein [Dysosmobacter sp.]|uniref:DEAD/DEAH box helicase family protein n=1 Tax=Dysosmobacter sp. TaxID=2591382 RepID=UPI003AF0C98A
MQESVRHGNQRFLFEMATGTGKTLTSAAVIRLFLRSGNANRVLFLVDRIELENQAKKNFQNYLAPDYHTVIFKENVDDWRKAEVVVSTVQTLMFNNKYKRFFKPTDFSLIIADESHRSINGNSRAVFEYFLGYKLGLTATPKDYIKNIDVERLKATDPRAWEKRQLLDSYKTFGCESGDPTYRYSLLDGVRDGYLINPTVVDARTDITTKLLADEGYAVISQGDEADEEQEETYFARDFEKKFFSEETNKMFVKTFMDNALRDPITGEIGKGIIFCVSRKHAAKITQLLNVYADMMFPGKYCSDFAMQITSDVKVTPCFENGKSGLAKNLENGIGFGSSEFFVLRANPDRVLPEYIYYIINSNRFISEGTPQMTGTGGLRRLTKDFVLNYPVSLPPLDEQRKIVNQTEEEIAIVEQNKRLIEIFEKKINDKISEVWGE